MRTWQRARIETACGACGRKVAEGDPILLLQGAGWSTPKYRCPEHADENVPDDLPPLPTHEELVNRQPQVRLGHVIDGLPLDFKQRGAGREPGEDDE